jgi:plastocyanin
MRSSKVVLALTAVTLVACGGEKKAADTAAATPSPAQSPTAAGPQTPDPGGKVITVNLVTDEKGNYFEPKEVEAHKGDVIRYTLKAGVHNIHFLADSNAGKSGFPTTPSDLLQLPGQTYDLKVSFAKGKYFFQCDPHAALGMVGHLEVE